jgi:hypothetical protein
MSSSPATGNSRLPLLLIAGTPLVVVLAASWLWYFVIQGNLDLVTTLGTSNNGALITPPRQIRAAMFTDDVGAAFAWQDLDPRWTIVMVNRGSTCNDACQRRLYFTRQVHIALGKEFNRVQRVLVTDTATEAVLLSGPASQNHAQLARHLESQHQGLVPLVVGGDAMVSHFPEITDSDAQWFLVDPAGWVMMRFGDELDYKAVISDLKFLLKNSGGAQ